MEKMLINRTNQSRKQLQIAENVMAKERVIMNGGRIYYTLIVKCTMTNKWCIHFGDYERQTVEQEREDLLDSEDNLKRRNTKIITTSDEQADINEYVRAYNIKF